MVAGVDMCATATATFAANFPGVHVVTSRLEDVEMGVFKTHVGPIDILLASPECRNHSCAKGSAPRDELSRATAMHVVEYAAALRPRWLVLENVVYMRPWSRYGELKRGLGQLGYHLHEWTLDASDFGVAQSRRRLFLVGDLDGPPNPSLQVPELKRAIGFNDDFRLPVAARSSADRWRASSSSIQESSVR